MTTVKQIYDFIDGIAPFSSALEDDNVGLLVGDFQKQVQKVIVSLDINKKVINEAINEGADLIVAHHPVIYAPLSNLIPENNAYLLASSNISAICAHTNLDAASGGVNDVLAEKIGLNDIKGFHLPEEDIDLGRVGILPEEMTINEFTSMVKDVLSAACIQYSGSAKVKKVALVSGAGNNYIKYAIAQGVDTFLTGETKYFSFLEAEDLGYNMVVAGHFATENIVIPVLKERLEKAFPNIQFIISRANNQLPYVV